jgi:GDP-L-fucose synthase
MINLDDPILITGANGGLGIATIKIFKNAGYNNLLTPSRNELDLLKSDDVLRFFREKRPVAVIHLASIVFGLQGNLDNQMKSLHENTLINSNIFEAINQFPTKYIFYAGTVAAYSYPYKNIPLLEQDFFDGLPHSGEFGYAMAKRHAYAYLHILKKTRDIKFTYGIFTNLYGENDRFNIESGHVIPSLIAKAFSSKKNNTTFDVWGNGEAERDFLHFDDAARAVLCCMQKDITPELVNISSNISITIKSLTNLIIQAAKLHDLRYQIDKPVGIKSRVVDNNVLLSLGFKPSIDIETGINNLYSWYEKNNDKVRK